MAKSLRASSKVKARNARRYTPGSDYQVANAARVNALSKRLMARMKGKQDGEAEQDEGSTEEAEAGEEEEGAEEDQKGAKANKVKSTAQGMDIEGEEAKRETKKVSTSGSRESRRETWRKARGWKPKQGTKNGGKPKRRR